MRLSLRPGCTCGSTNNKHRFSCDLWYAKIQGTLKGKLRPKKKKQFFFFYPLKKVDD